MSPLMPSAPCFSPSSDFGAKRAFSAASASAQRKTPLAPAPVTVATEKIVRQPPEALVRNYVEVRAALRAAGEA